MKKFNALIKKVSDKYLEKDSKMESHPKEPDHKEEAGFCSKCGKPLDAKPPEAELL